MNKKTMMMIGAMMFLIGSVSPIFIPLASGLPIYLMLAGIGDMLICTHLFPKNE